MAVSIRANYQKNIEMSCFVERMQRKKQRRQATTQDAEGVYLCSSCGYELFEENKKFDSGTGFPSFWMHIGQHVRQQQLNTYGRERIQLVCNRCNQHLGHLFPNKKTPTQLRYCINAASITFEEEAQES